MSDCGCRAQIFGHQWQYVRAVVNAERAPFMFSCESRVCHRAGNYVAAILWECICRNRKGSNNSGLAVYVLLLHVVCYCMAVFEYG